MWSRQPTLVLVLVFYGWQSALAHQILVDGDATDWIMLPPAQENLGHIARNPSLFGEYVWSDAQGDERNHFKDRATPNPRYDMFSFRITATCEEIYFLIRLNQIQISSGAGAPMAQIALDVDQDPTDKCQRGFAQGADTQVHSHAAWE